MARVVAYVIVLIITCLVVRTFWTEVVRVLWREWRANKPMETRPNLEQFYWSDKE